MDILQKRRTSKEVAALKENGLTKTLTIMELNNITTELKLKRLEVAELEKKWIEINRAVRGDWSAASYAQTNFGDTWETREELYKQLEAYCVANNPTDEERNAYAVELGLNHSKDCVEKRVPCMEGPCRHAEGCIGTIPCPLCK
jgi:hypothetical protein